MQEQDKPSFEKALARLEEIVRLLEAGDLDLEAALGLYEEGVKLSGHCARLLDSAEKRIELVTRAKNGAVELEAFKVER